MDNKNLVSGIYPKKPKVDFIKASFGIKKAEFVEWFKQQDKQEEWINIDIKESKGGNLYAELNTWKPNNEKKEEDDLMGF
tara:strand:+ start:1474 stop:1713 length:240 start_codon:yes stop_codon:yes gene_type:complete